MNKKSQTVYIAIIIILLLLLGYMIIQRNNHINSIYEYESSQINNATNLQFLNNMRFQSRDISYNISEDCRDSTRKFIEDGFEYIDNRTLINFYQKDNADISSQCIYERRNFGITTIVGEGGPSYIIGGGVYNIIGGGEIKIYTDNKCTWPVSTVHEILHALGFEHKAEVYSVLNPVLECDQILDEEVIDRINELYSVESLPDLLFTNISVNRTGSLADIEVSIANHGLIKSESFDFIIIKKNKNTTEHKFSNISVNTVAIYKVDNLRLRGDNFTFYLHHSGDELNKTNNYLEFQLK